MKNRNEHKIDPVGASFQCLSADYDCGRTGIETAVHVLFTSTSGRIADPQILAIFLNPSRQVRPNIPSLPADLQTKKWSDGRMQTLFNAPISPEFAPPGRNKLGVNKL
jgi:hypothetical protein